MPLHVPASPRLPAWLCAGAAAALLAGPAAAQGLSLSGFASLVLGRTAGACTASAALGAEQADNCTRFVADWAHGGLYTDRPSLRPESRAGLQADWAWHPALTLTTQLTTRALPKQALNLEWAYATWRPAEHWQLQLGRKRLPLYHYSDFQDVGFAYDTIRPSADVYGWDIVNYNGLSAAYSTRLGGWNLRAEFLAGGERSTDNRFLGLFGMRQRTIEWRNIRGVVAETGVDGWSGRLSHMVAEFRQRDDAAGLEEVPVGGPRHVFTGAAIGHDAGRWVWRSEYGVTRRSSLNYAARFHSSTLGYRIDQGVLTVGASGYQERRLDTGEATYGHHSLVLAWRRELGPGKAMKLQVDRVRDTTLPLPAVGHALVLSASYDMIF